MAPRQIGLSDLPLQASARLVLFGHSIKANSASFNTNYAATNAKGLDTWGQALTKSRLFIPPNGNLGVAGDTLVNMITPARLAPLVALRGAYVSLLCATNSLTGGATLATLTAQYGKIIRTARANGSIVELQTELPRFGANALTAGQETLRQQLNAYLRSLASGNIVLVDFDTLTLTSADFLDGLHPNPSGAFKMGVLVASVRNKVFGSDGVNLADGIINCATTNPEFAGTTGTKAGTATGTVATSWQLTNAGSGGATVVGSKVFDANGIEGQRIVVSGNYTGTGLSIQLNGADYTTAANLPANGGAIEGVLDFEIVGTPVGISAVSLTNVVYTSGYAATLGRTETMIQDAQTTALPAGLVDQRVTMRSPALNLGAGVPAIFTNGVTIMPVDAGSSSPISMTLNVWKAAGRAVPSYF